MNTKTKATRSADGTITFRAQGEAWAIWGAGDGRQGFFFHQHFDAGGCGILFAMNLESVAAAVDTEDQAVEEALLALLAVQEKALHRLEKAALEQAVRSCS